MTRLNFLIAVVLAALLGGCRHAPDQGTVVLPVGAIVAYPHDGMPPLPWLTCDGKPIPDQYSELKALVGGNTPDLRGVFLRGSGRNDDKDGALSYDGNPQRKVGTLEDFSTCLEEASRKTGGSGNHAHALHVDHSSPLGSGPRQNDVDYLATAAGGGTKRWSAGMDIAGDHSHPIAKGAEETRPVNYAVQWVIKAK